VISPTRSTTTGTLDEVGEMGVGVVREDLD
jgi:hypothetical protein